MEVNAKLSKGQGSWPAIWMMPENSIYGSWPYSGEIDIMEHLNFDDFIYQTVHSEYIDVYQEKNNPPYSNTV
ncbi:MAG TPA: family 16 glycosylhydrolase, partial [Defluviitaleaceae bacterium]|nr:family 16 glycosylhydrolase [Defluviitaleaceae bacterium]